MSAFYDDPAAFGFEHVERFNGRDSYDWAEAAIYKRLLDGKYFYYIDSGCSCNSFGDELNSPEALTELNGGTLPDLCGWIDNEYRFDAAHRVEYKHKAAMLIRPDEAPGIGDS